jgi:hypothetical protein
VVRRGCGVDRELLGLDSRAATFIPSIELGLIQQTAQSVP